jgi:hypothetical protein
MPIIKNVGDELLDLYKGFDSTLVGPGTISPDIYKTPGYSKKKIQTLMIGNLTKIFYGGYEHQRDPLIIPFRIEPAYNTVLGIQLGYCPLEMRESVINFILKSNAARIKSNLPMIIDYDSLKRAIPAIKYITRRYKTVLIRVEESVPLVEWDRAIREEGTKWQNHWKDIKEGKAK